MIGNFGSAWRAGATCLLVAACVTLAACAEDDAAVDLSQGCDIRDTECQRAVFDLTAELRGDGVATLPPVRTIDVAQFEDELRDAVADASAEDDNTRAWGAALQLLGLLPPEMDLEDAVVADRVDSVAAYYEGDEQRVTVIDRGDGSDPQDDVFVLAHELVHALQDQQFDLRDFRRAWVDSTDSEVAISCLIEGEAMVVGASVLERTMGSEVRLDWAAFIDSLGDGVTEAIDEAPVPFLAAINQLPYWLGTRELEPVWRTEGPAGIEDLFAEPPRSLLDFTQGSIDDPGAQVQELECHPTGAPDSYVAVDHDSLGLAGLTALRMALGDPAGWAWSQARGWRGDSVVVFEREGGGDEYAAAWRIRFDDMDSASDLEVELAQIGAQGFVSESRRELLIFAASAPSVALDWEAVLGCGSADDLPEPDAAIGEMMQAAAGAVSSGGSARSR
ncbi:MAG: hypothetical protein PVI30_06755 [Myxococcales bacterium]